MTKYLRLIIYATSVSFAACGSQPTSLTAPTAATPTSALGANAGLGAVPAVTHAFSTLDTRVTGHVEGEDPVSRLIVGTACPTLSFVIDDITVKVTPATVFTGGTCADIKPGVRLGVKGDAGSDGTLAASSIVVKGDASPRFVDGDAVVASIVSGTSCPTLSFVVEGHTIKTDSTTKYSSGACSDIRPGVPLTIQGLMSSDGTVTASHLVLKGEHPTDVDGNALITSVVTGTTCPTRSFIAEGHTVQADAKTTYEGGTCADLKVGVHVQIKGLLLSDGSVTAIGIQFKNADGSKDVDGDDIVTSIAPGSVCPTLQFVIAGVTVKTSASTQFVSGVCADVAVGVKVEVRGTMLNNIVQATLVRLER